jgi:hypothetical protein
MAYENYRFVSWSNGTPITGERMAQLSTNIEQVKLATDDRPQGVIKYSKLTALQSYASGNVAKNTLVNLRDDTPSGSDNRVSADSDRFVRLMVTFPGIKISARGAEDTRYELTINQGLDTDPSPTILSKFYLNPHIYAFYDVSASASTTTVSVRSSGNNVYFGAGSYSTVIDSSTGLSNVNFFVSIQRIANSNMTNSPGYTVMSSSSSPLEFYAEDIGGTS